MPEPTEEQRRAYELGEQAGGTKGRDEDFYRRAEQELRNTDTTIRCERLTICRFD